MWILRHIFQELHTINCVSFQHTSAAETLQDIGGIEFLTLLRKDVTAALQPVVDQILENTMRLPDAQESLDHAPECIYQKQNHTGSLFLLRLTLFQQHFSYIMVAFGVS